MKESWPMSVDCETMKEKRNEPQPLPMKTGCGNHENKLDHEKRGVTTKKNL